MVDCDCEHALLASLSSDLKKTAKGHLWMVHHSPFLISNESFNVYGGMAMTYISHWGKKGFSGKVYWILSG